jgi:type VI secretion system protein ImpI
VFGLEVKIINTQEGTTTERRFERFPVRIGRNPLNDLQLDSAYVSQFHAIVDLVGEKPHLVDLGSRNGTLVPGHGRVQPQTSIDLTPYGNEFAITPTIFRLAVVDFEPSAQSRRRGGVHDFAEEMTRPHGTDVGAALVTHIRPLYEEYRQAWTRVYQEIMKTIGTYEPEMRARFCEELMVAHPNLAAEPDFKRLAQIGPPSGTHIPIDVETSATFDPPREEAVALHGVKQLASWYLPNSPSPAGVEDVLGFLQSVQDTLDIFLKCFVPLRDAYKQFEVQMDIRRAPSAQGGPNTVENARDPRELARAMLDWRHTTGEEPRAVENTFADLMTHQVALLNGVMKGVKQLLGELAPEEIERSLEDPRKNRNRQGLQIGPFRFKQLWELYQERHSDLSAEDRQAFAVIFGPQFAQAYAQFVEGAAQPGTHTVEVRAITNPTGNATQPPPPPYWPPRR